MEVNLSFYICGIQTCIYYIPVTRSRVFGRKIPPDCFVLYSLPPDDTYKDN